MSRTFGCVRLVYNKALQLRSESYRLYGQKVSYAATDRALTGWKRQEELAFLREVSSVPLQQAFHSFFNKQTRYPRFKSRKKSKASATYTRSAFRLRDGELRLAKMADPLDIVWSRPLPEGAEPSMVTVSRDRAGRWFVCLLCEDTIEALPQSEGAVGVDAGITDRRTDFLHQLSTRLVRENQTVVLEDLNIANIVM